MSVAEGPYFEDLRVGQVFSGAPSMTLTEGRAAAHQAITADRLRLPLDAELCRRVTGTAVPLAHPALVWDVAIGQSTLVTRHVVANLFYRGLAFHRAPLIGDTLRTRTEVVALRQNRPRPARPATGLVALRITTVDQHGHTVLDFWRCAMLPLRDPEASTGHRDELDDVGAAGAPEVPLSAAVQGWSLDVFRDAAAGTHLDGVHPGAVWETGGGDVVSSAPELARLTLNVAAVHHDAGAGGGGRRLVYGGHTIGLALSQATRVLPNLVTVTGWHGCDHTGPVREGDTLTSTVEVQRVEELPGGSGGLAHLRSTVRAASAAGAGAEPHDVLDWRYVAVLA
ncbi:MAG: acyl dehydratase [Pseudonocardiaceae bacterium]|nr:acyl dehydratase [Pseudonocardiaceae bacterium]